MSSPLHCAEKPSWHFALLIAFPLLLLWGIISSSPNFDFSKVDVVSTIPLGGDYLQEYVGGQFINDSAIRDQLYDSEAFKRQQHLRESVGFAWDENQYFPAVYPTLWYAAVSPLSRLEYDLAVHIWATLMAVCLIASFVLLYRFTDVPLPLLLIFCLSRPVIHSISSGQKGTLLLLIFTLSFLLLKQLKPVRSGVVFALSVFKPHLGVCIGVWMLVSGRWRWAIATLSTVATLVAISIITLPGLSKDYVNVCLGFGDYVQSGGYDLAKSYSLWSSWQMLIPNPTIAKILTLVTSLTVFIGSLIWLKKIVKRDPEKTDVAFAAMVLVTAITAPHFYYYDLTMLILPVAIFASRASLAKFNRQLWLPVVLIAAAMFGSGLIEKVGLTTNLSLGPVLLIIALVAALRMPNVGEEEARPGQAPSL
ncbi:DUF2029 domain-containing protein [bacterium]|nr:DUF2029 domain-containing protein [bacterium]